MSRNGSGTYSLPAGNPVVTGTTISSTWSNTTLTDIANALTGSLASDGQTTASGNLNMGTNKITNTADPTAEQDVATKYYTDTTIAADILATVTPAFVSDKVNTSTGYFQVAKGNTAQRPAVPLEGIIRYNTDIDIYEGYINGDWIKFQTFSQGVYTSNYLVIAGGGGGSSSAGNVIGGGGGAGGAIASTTTFTPGVTYYFVVGGGGGSATAGTNSSITSIVTALGGGRGGNTGGSGGSGGGNSGTGTSGQGNNAGSGNGALGGGGGGGAGSAGANGTTGGGAGGAGAANTLTGSSITYAGGGGGGSSVFAGGSGGGAGGSGGGGAGSGTVAGSNGTTNTGSGGGGAGWNGTDYSGGNGGSGVIIISVPTVNYTGTVTGAPTVTTNGANTVMKFNSSGTYLA
jgi:hypothetical protein